MGVHIENGLFLTCGREHTSCPDQAAPGCPDVRVHPAAPTSGYTRLPQPVRVRSWGGWVRNGVLKNEIVCTV
jgi:hypothetical protein